MYSRYYSKAKFSLPRNDVGDALFIFTQTGLNNKNQQKPTSKELLGDLLRSYAWKGLKAASKQKQHLEPLVILKHLKGTCGLVLVKAKNNNLLPCRTSVFWFQNKVKRKIRRAELWSSLCWILPWLLIHKNKINVQDTRIIYKENT